ncbi:hypothetical protein K4K58_001970 [Colletotrichum sp. SAR11_239]|nr:hypothetical protein K4K58_001970 [Colletotrichum sp. SAR11_239]
MMSAAGRIRVESDPTVAQSLASLRQAHSLHAQQQLNPDAVPGIWESLRADFWKQVQRRYLAVPPAQRPQPDPRDFVPFLRNQLSDSELEFSLFVVFRPHRTYMRSVLAGAELKRRYSAFKGNATDRTEDDCAFELGTGVLRSVTALKTINSLLNPRGGDGFSADEVFAAIRHQMLLREHTVDAHPDPTCADVAAAATALRAARAISIASESIASSARPTPAPAVDQHPGPAAQVAPSPLAGIRRSGSPLQGPPARRRRLFPDDFDDDGAEPLLEPSPQPQVPPGPEPQPQQQPQQEAVEEDAASMATPEQARSHPRPGRNSLSPAPLRTPLPGLGPVSPVRLRTPSPPPQQELGSSPMVFVTPEAHIPPPNAAGVPATPAQVPDIAADVPPGASPPAQIPPVGRQAAYAETRRWLSIVRQIRDMPDPQGSILWCSVIYVFVQAAEAVAAWCEEILDQEALED